MHPRPPQLATVLLLGTRDTVSECFNPVSVDVERERGEIYDLVVY